MRVLIVRLGAFGDIVHTLPLAADLAAAGHDLGWLCEDRWSVLLHGSPALRRVHELPRRTLRGAQPVDRWLILRRLRREMRAVGYEVVIDAQGLAKSAALALLSGAPRRIGHHRARAREGSWLVSRRRTPAGAEHVIDQQRALGLAIGVRARGGWRFPLPAWTAQRSWARRWLDGAGLHRPWLLNVGAGWPTKVWPAQRQREFAALVTAAGHPLVVLWGSGAERTVAEEVAASARAVLAPPTAIPELAGLIAEGAVLVSGDTGPLHLARALGTPAVGLFGPVPARRNGPRGRSWCNLQAPGAAWERRDAAKVDMGAIGAAEALAAACSVGRGIGWNGGDP